MGLIKKYIGYAKPMAYGLGLTLLLGCSLSYATTTYSPPPTTIVAQGSIEVAFSPHNGVTSAVANVIKQAKKNILVEAYSFTSVPIARALLDAKKRGVLVTIILDKSQTKPGYSAAKFFANNSFDLRIDIQHAIFHDKVLIIDDKTVVTGSFNFTNAAEKKNAENLLILRDNPQLAKLYTQDFNYNYQQALIYADFMHR